MNGKTTLVLIIWLIWALNRTLWDDVATNLIIRAATRAVVLEEICSEAFISRFYSIFKCIEILIDPDGILLNHTFLVE